MGSELKLGRRTGIRALAAVAIAALIVGIAGAPAVSAASTRNHGYWIAGADAQVFGFGDAQTFASADGRLIRGLIEDAAAHPLGKGYWLLGRDGGVYPYGDARDLGQGAFQEQNAVAIASTPSGNGYWIASASGEVRAFGDAPVLGSLERNSQRRIVDMAATGSGRGYWLVDANGEVFAFGDAPSLGSSPRAGGDVVAMAATPHGDGYWIATSGGETFAFGTAPALPGLTDPAKKIVDMTATATGRGYWLVDRNGLVFAFGDAVLYGQLAPRDLRSGQIVAIVSTPFVNRDPVAAPDTASLDEDTTVDVNVLANDTDEDGDPLTAAVQTDPGHGTATLNADGTIRYTPAHDYNGTDSFLYRVSDGVGGSAIGQVTLVIRPVNDAPVAAADAYDATEDTALVVPGPGVLGNDIDVDGDALTAELVETTSHGTLTLTPDGGISYVPSADFNGTDSFRYLARDVAGAASVTVTVTIQIAAVNDAPATQDDRFGATEDQELRVDAPGVLANDHDVDSPSFTAELATGPAHGTLALVSDGSFAYTPSANFNGIDSFTYRATDGLASSGDTTVTIFVAPVNDPPVGAPDSYTTNEDTAIFSDAPGVMANDSDVDGDELRVRLSTPPAHGDVALFADGSFIYTPDLNYNGADGFEYDLSDGSAVLAGITVTITIVPVDDPPTAADDSYATTVGTTLSIDAPGVLANDFDDSGTLTAVLVTTASHGALTLNADGSFTYTTSLATAGTDAFTYKVTDGTTESAPATVQLTIASSGGGGGGSGTFGGYANPTLVVWDFDTLDLHVAGTTGFKTKIGQVIAKYGELWYVPDRGRGHDTFTIGTRTFQVDVISDIWGD